MKEVGKAPMRRLVVMTILKLCGEAILITLVVAIVIGVIGNRNQWDSALAYSNAFFIAGCLVIIAGASSRLAAGQEWSSFQLLHSESFRDMGRSERANYIVTASSSFRLVILGLLSGIMLILISAFAMNMI